MEEKTSLFDEFSFLEEAEDYIDVNGVTLYDWCMTNDEYGKQIMLEWSDKNEGHFNEPLSIREVYCKDTKKYWWHCSYCGADYYSQLFKRLYNHRGCPACAGIRGGRKLTENAAINGESIKNYCQHAINGNQVLSEWNEEKNLKEFGFTIENVPSASNKIAWWTCSNCNNNYKKMIYSRVKMNQSCHDCGRAGTSVQEQFIYWALKQIDDSLVHRGKYFGGYEYDLYSPQQNLYIEYNGMNWHKGKEDRDQLKRKLCLDNGGRFLSICVSRDYEKDSYSTDNIEVRDVSSNFEEKLSKVIDYIVELFYQKSCEINYKQAYDNAVRHVYTVVENSVAQQFPMLIKEFSKDENGGYRLESLTCGSNARIKWICSSCGHGWESRIADRTARKSGCPKCKHNVFK